MPSLSLPTLTRYCIAVLLMALFGWMFLYSAWLCDDSYISFRIIQNYSQDLGLTWNAGQRVQAFSHPLWMIFLYLSHSVGNIFEGTLWISILMGGGAVFLLCKSAVQKDHSMAMFIPIAMLGCSKSFIDYSSSGLENPLSYGLFGLLIYSIVTKHPRNRNFLPAILPFLLILNRMDLAIIVAPLLLQQLWRNRSAAIRSMLPGLILLVLWLGFATLYFGFPFPNTYYAKLQALYPLGDYIVRGQDYYRAQLDYDPLTLVLIFGGILAGQLQKRLELQCLSFGVLLYMIYILWIGGDFMLGRFFAVPSYIAVWLLVELIRISRWQWSLVLSSALIGCAVAYLQYPTVHIPLYDARIDYESRDFLIRNIADERAGYYQKNGLLSPSHSWPKAKKSVKKKVKPSVQCIGLGRSGLRTPPHNIIIDACALTDPFLARLPAINDPDWDIGHLRRYIPENYLDTLHTQKNQFRNPAMAALWDDIDSVSQGEIWSIKRIQAIFRLNFSSYGIDTEKLRNGQDYLQYEGQRQVSPLLISE